MRHLFLPAAFVLLGLSVRLTLSAEEASPRTDDRPPQALADALSRAAARPADPQAALARARSGLGTHIDQLDQFLSQSTPQERQQWFAFLGAPTIRDELAKPQVDVIALREIQRRYFQNQSGLELPAVVAVRSSLTDLLTAADYASADSPAEQYRQKLAELEESLAQLDANPSDDAAQHVGQVVAWLAPLSNEGAALATAVRTRYCRSNGTAQVSQRFINLMLAQAVAEQRFITEMILGSRTTGFAQTQAQVLFGTVPDQGRGTLEVRLEGRTDCPANVAQRGRISIFSSAQTSIRASKQVHISDLGLALAPATAACATSVRISDVEAGSRLIQRLALRRANQLAPQAEQAASRKAETEASGKLDQEANAALGQMNKFFREQFRAPLIRRGALPTQLSFSTDDQHLRLVMAQYNSVQLGATTDPPQLPAEIDLGGAIHESLVRNFCETLLQGVAIEDRAWQELMILLTGDSPRPLWVHDRAERWSVTMARQRPVVVQFADKRMALTFRFDRVTRGGRHHDSLVEIEARFTPQITADGPAFTRQGDVQIRIAEGNSPDHGELRTFLARKFGAVLPPELHLSGLVPPAGASLGKLRQLELTELTSDRGWLTIGYRLDSGRIASRTDVRR
ncbi:MAG TPA: hypothetical protein VMP01_14215 [Pirellulaceae bacterium]|nr:hypothetical protein [Pirellulaceae bacterium]